MQTLLTLPPELRLEVYKYVLSDQPIEIDINEYWTDNDPKFWKLLGEPLARLDSSLASDIEMLHWSRVTITFSEKIIPEDYKPNEKYISWLLHHTEAMIHVLGRLKFQRHWQRSANIPHPRCINFAEIDLRTGKVCLGNTDGDRLICEHGVLTKSRMEAALDEIPRKRGRPQPKLSDLWKLWELWRLTFYKNPAWPRRWDCVRSSYTGSFSV